MIFKINYNKIIVSVLIVFFSFSLVQQLYSSAEYDKLLAGQSEIDNGVVFIKNARKFIDINIDSVFFYANSAIAAAKLNSDSLLLSDGYLYKGIALKKKGDYFEAINYIFKSLDIKDKFGELNGSINCRLNIGNCYLGYGNVYESESKFDEAIIQYQKAKDNFGIALNYALDLKDSTRIARVYQNLGSASFLMYEYPKSIEFFQKGQTFEPGITRLEKYPESQMNIASCLFEMGKDTEAQKIYADVLDFFDDNHQNYQWITCKINLAAVFWDVDPQLSIKTLLEADSAAIQLNDSNIRIDITNKLSELYGSQNQSTKALKYYKIYDKLKGNVLSLETETKLEDLRLKYNNEKTEKELVLSESEKEKAQSRNKVLIASIIVAISSILFLIVYLIQRQKANNLKRLKNKAKFDEEVTQLLANQELDRIDSMLTGQETERKRIAEDLHDRLGSLLSATRMYVDSGTSGEKNVRENKEKVCGLLDKAISETRDIAHNLESGILSKFGLEAAIRDLKDTIEGSGTIKFKFSTTGVSDKLDSEIEITLYRIIQEAVSNVLKHSNARLISLSINKTNPNQYIMLIEDNGKGFDKESIEMGMGIKNIEARVSKMKGQFDLISSINSGTKIKIIF